MVMTGLRAERASWSTSVIRSPRSLRRASSLNTSRSASPRRSWSASTRVFSSPRPMMARAVTDLPEPDSPRSATNSPPSMLKSTSIDAQIPLAHGRYLWPRAGDRDGEIPHEQHPGTVTGFAVHADILARVLFPECFNQETNLPNFQINIDTDAEYAPDYDLLCRRAH